MISPGAGEGGVATRARDALLRQWGLLVDAAPALDLDRPSRIEGWRNREVLAHLASQPLLLRHFLQTATSESPGVTLAENLSGTVQLASVINDAALEGAREERVNLAASVQAATPALLDADLATTVTTFQGPILLADYLVTRCVEAVVHGRDLLPAVEPDADALGITVEALIAVLTQVQTSLVPEGPRATAAGLG
ncbi:MAG TPA: maleylpyruvate isomerase N-terminal domain-containing protein [Acidimicrobiia bacterium]